MDCYGSPPSAEPANLLATSMAVAIITQMGFEVAVGVEPMYSVQLTGTLTD